MAGDAGGIWAAVIGAVAPALMVSSLDARMYVLATTLVLASTLCLLRALERPSLLRWALYAALSILAVYTVYFALFAVFAQVVDGGGDPSTKTLEPSSSSRHSAR